jgi:hypothetical protein
VDSQPGMIQLLIGVKSHVQVSRSTAASAEKELDSNAGVDLVSIFFKLRFGQKVFGMFIPKH